MLDARAGLIRALDTLWVTKRAGGRVAKRRKASAVLKDSIEGRSNNSFNASANQVALMREARFNSSARRAALIRALGSGFRIRVMSSEPFVRLLGCLHLTLSLCAVTQAKEWRGIVPLHSTRSDVERLLGPSATPGAHVSSHETEDEVVTVIYASGPPCDMTSEWKVPRGTVVNIRIAPKRQTPLTSLITDRHGYEQFEDPLRKGLFTYTDEEEGVRFTVMQIDEAPGELVVSVDYFPGKEDDHLRCISPRAGLRNERPPLEQYGDIPFSIEKARLDNFAIVLQAQPELEGYIIFSGGQSLPADQARTRAERAKDYLVNVRGISHERVAIIVGGPRKAFLVQLYAVPTGSPPPVEEATTAP
jgi:hypothetical protein